MFQPSTNLSDRDALTGLKNRRFLDSHFQQLATEGARFGMILVDIDGLAYFNNHYGHLKADEFLIAIAHLLSQSIPSQAEICRTGGDEFTIFLTGLRMGEVVSTALNLCQIIKHRFSEIPPIERNYFFPDRSSTIVNYGLTISCGVAFYPEHGTKLATLYEAADLAMLPSSKRFSGGMVAVAEFPKSIYSQGDR